MLQTRASALIRLEFLTRFMPDLQPGSMLYNSAIEECAELIYWLDRQKQRVRTDTRNVVQMEAVSPEKNSLLLQSSSQFACHSSN